MASTPHRRCSVFYLLRSGCAWRMLPREYPPWQTVYYHFQKWRLDDRLRQAHERLKLLGGRELTVVTVDMPLSTTPITGRREADAAISRAFGGMGAAVHSPNAERPGAISDQLTRDFAAMGFPLATSTTPAGTPKRVVEVYPHPALMTLTGASYRLCYKVSRSRKYWPDRTPAERRANLLVQFQRILSALNDEIRDLPIELPDPTSAVPVSGLKRYEDSLDALVCAWVGMKYLEGEAVAYGDHTAAIWIP
jgi:predicted RNase H-like nuclease